MEATVDPIVELFAGFSVSHSWYKRLEGETKFLVAPTGDRWCIAQEGSGALKNADPATLAICKKYPVGITPFVYEGYSPNAINNFMWTAGHWGWPMFDWLIKMGYTDEAKFLRAHCTDNSAAGDSRNKIIANAHKCEEGEALKQLYKKEYARMLASVKNTIIAIAQDLKKPEKAE